MALVLALAVYSKWGLVSCSDDKCQPNVPAGNPLNSQTLPVTVKIYCKDTRDTVFMPSYSLLLPNPPLPESDLASGVLLGTRETSLASALEIKARRVPLLGRVFRDTE